MKIISPLLKNVIYPGLSRTGYLSQRENRRPVVVTYHGILPEGYRMRHPALDGHLISANRFRKQAQLLKSRYNLISPAQFLAWSQSKIELPVRSVLLTCDDGLLNTLTDMVPIIHDLDLPFLFFVTGASASDERSTLWHEECFLWLSASTREKIQSSPMLQPYFARSSEPTVSIWRYLLKDLSRLPSLLRENALERLRTQLGISQNWAPEYSQGDAFSGRFRMMNAIDLRKVVDAGITVAAHTLSHPMLSRMTESDAFSEIAGSKSCLEAITGKPVWALAYPFGDAQAVTVRETQLARRAGFSCAFTNTENETSSDMFAYPRVHVSCDTGVAELDARVSGFHSALRRRTGTPGVALAD